MKLLVFAATNHFESINRKLVLHAARVAQEIRPDIEIISLDLNDYEMPIYRQDREAEGYPPQAQDFLDQITGVDAVVVSYAEHNGNYTTAYKNLLDWASRIKRDIFDGKPLVVLSTSPGGRGGTSVLEIAKTAAPHFGADLKGSLPVPLFGEVFDLETASLTDPDLSARLRDEMARLVAG